MQDLSHTHIHHTINQIGVSQSPPLKSLTSSLGLTLWSSVTEPTRDYRAGSDTICNDPRKSVSHICAIPQNDQSQLRLFVVVNKAQIYLVNTRYGTHHTPTHITQSIKLGYHNQTLALVIEVGTPTTKLPAPVAQPTRHVTQSPNGANEATMCFCKIFYQNFKGKMFYDFL